MRVAALIALLFVGCSSASTRAPAASTATRTTAIESALAAPTAPSWANVTQSPSLPLSTDLALTECGEPDGALTRTAMALAAERSRGEVTHDPEHVIALLRENGEPHVRPRVMSASGVAPMIDVPSVRAELALLKKDATQSRCGVATAPIDATHEVVVAIAVDAIADLEPMPTHARTGEWLTLTAPLHAAVTNAKVIVMGPRGLPRTVPTSLDRTGNGVRVRARFALDRPGAFNVQLIGDLAHGPQPILEASVFADVAPFANESPAPGEDAPRSKDDDDASSLTKMIAALRSSEALTPLTRDDRLDALARSHAEQMRKKKTVAHDLGDGEGDLATRFEATGLLAKVVGENVARAHSITLAHRILHASPSHRMNLLRADYTHVGVGVVAEGDDVFVCEVFASGMTH